jgi:hypothetical protein
VGQPSLLRNWLSARGTYQQVSQITDKETAEKKEGVIRNEKDKRIKAHIE